MMGYSTHKDMGPPAGPWTLHTCADASVQARELAQTVARHLKEAVAARGQALLAVSGGRSPVPLFEALRKQDLPWKQVTVLLVDERVVDPRHPDSNAALVCRHLLRGAAAAARWLPYFDQLPPHVEGSDWSDAELDALASAAEQRLAELGSPLDVVLLGMGEDGHTASLFPGSRGLHQALQGPGLVAWTRPTTAAYARLTLTLPALVSARSLILSIQGLRKKAVLERAGLMPTPDLPVSLVLHQAPVPVQVWIAPDIPTPCHDTLTA